MVVISPIGLSTTPVANQLSLMVSFKEKLCRAIKTNPSATVTINYSYGNMTLSGSTVYIPITASVTIQGVGCNGCSALNMFSETFEVAFQGRTTIPTSVTITSLGKYVKVLKKVCVSVKEMEILDSLTITVNAEA